MIVILSARPCAMTLAVTLPPATSGLPTLTVGALADHQDLVELDGLAHGDFELLDPNALSGARAVLLTAGAKNGIHD